MGNRAPCQTIRPRRHVVYPRYASYGNVFVATNGSWPRKEEKKKKREEKRKKKAAAARWPVKVGQGRGEPRSLGEEERGRRGGRITERHDRRNIHPGSWPRSAGPSADWR